MTRKMVMVMVKGQGRINQKTKNNKLNKKYKTHTTMKKTLLTLAIVLGLSMTTFADGGGLFQRGAMPEQEVGIFGKARTAGNTPSLPMHNELGDQDADAPLGTGIAVLAVLGGAYLVGKKRR